MNDMAFESRHQSLMEEKSSARGAITRAVAEGDLREMERAELFALVGQVTLDQVVEIR